MAVLGFYVVPQLNPPSKQPPLKCENHRAGLESGNGMFQNQSSVDTEIVQYLYRPRSIAKASGNDPADATLHDAQHSSSHGR